jgi:hypothetical protein
MELLLAAIFRRTTAEQPDPIGNSTLIYLLLYGPRCFFFVTSGSVASCRNISAAYRQQPRLTAD